MLANMHMRRRRTVWFPCAATQTQMCVCTSLDPVSRTHSEPAVAIMVATDNGVCNTDIPSLPWRYPRIAMWLRGDCHVFTCNLLSRTHPHCRCRRGRCMRPLLDLAISLSRNAVQLAHAVVGHDVTGISHSDASWQVYRKRIRRKLFTVHLHGGRTRPEHVHACGAEVVASFGTTHGMAYASCK